MFLKIAYSSFKVSKILDYRELLYKMAMNTLTGALKTVGNQ